MSQTLQQKLNDVLVGGLKGGVADLETLANGHVCGHVISEEFEGLDFDDRRSRIRKLTDQAVQDGRLRSDEVIQISTLLTYTPGEWTVVSYVPNPNPPTID
jgi:hypothetical protein